MRDLYGRLKQIGFDKAFIRASVLPDWWEDSLAEVPFNRAVAEAAIAQHLGVHVKTLRQPTADLPQPSVADVCFKRNRRVAALRVAASCQVAKRAAHLAVACAQSIPAFTPDASAKALRERMTGDNASVTLGGLLDLCWGMGVVVVGIGQLPAGAAKFDGAAMFVRNTPVIVLASGRDGPAWLAFHLTHELGHLMCQHVRPFESAYFDTNLQCDVEDANELQADEFGLELLTGSADGVKFLQSGLNASQVGEAALNYARDKRPDLDPGTIVLSYCKSTTYWGVAKGALQAIGADKGGYNLIAERLNRYADYEALTESESRFLTAICRLKPHGIKDERPPAVC